MYHASATEFESGEAASISILATVQRGMSAPIVKLDHCSDYCLPDVKGYGAIGWVTALLLRVLVEAPAPGHCNG